jgi:hypothetical protein
LTDSAANEGMVHRPNSLSFSAPVTQAAVLIRVASITQVTSPSNPLACADMLNLLYFRILKFDLN